MPDQFSDDQINERIAERRAKTEQMRRKNQRRSLLQVIAVLLGLALVIVLIILGIRHAVKRMGTPTSNEAPTSQQSDLAMNPIEEEPEGSSWNTGSEDEEPEPQTPDQNPDAEPEEQNPEENPEQTPTEDPEENEPTEPAEPAGPELGEEPEEQFEAGAHAGTLIVVDAGRGYSDHGCSSDYLGEHYESQINLAVAKLVAAKLRQAGYTVLMTHSTNHIPDGEAEDYALDQLSRVELANTNQCAVYLSLHCDNFPDNEKASGTRLYYCTDVNGSAAFADALSAGTRQIMGAAPRIAGYGTDQAFVVTSQVEAPSVLVEMGFVTNQRDAENLLSADWREQLAQALSSGVIAYLEG